jgi:hypothetical protein
LRQSIGVWGVWVSGNMKVILGGPLSLVIRPPEGACMALRKRGKWWYGDSQANIRDEILRYSKRNEYPAHHFADAVCGCGGRLFVLRMDGVAGAAVRKCLACRDEHPIGDSGEYLDESQLQMYECVCLENVLEITVGVSLYDDSEDVRWLYVGCRCPKCALTGVYGDWKNEFNGYRELLARV